MHFKEGTFWIGLTLLGVGVEIWTRESGNKMVVGIVFAVIGLIGVVYPILAHHWADLPQMPKVPLWLGLLIMTWVAIGYEHYRGHTAALSPVAASCPAPTAPYRFAWKGDVAPTKIVRGKFFANEKVPVDDTTFYDCTFTNVTFVYDGTAPFQMNDSSIVGTYAFESNNPSIQATGLLLSGIGMLKVPLRDPDTNKPPINIHNAPMFKHIPKQPDIRTQ